VDTDFERSWRRRFERFAGAHEDDAGIAGWSEGGLSARLRRFAQIWHESRGDAQGRHWLDAGCGAGTYTRFLAGAGLDITAVDYSFLTTVKARQRGPSLVQWATADVTQLPFRDACFDGVLCFGVMQALSTPDHALREVRRVLRPGGSIWVDALNARCVPSALKELWRRVRRRPRHLRYDDPRKFMAAMKASGFEDIELYWVPIVPLRLHFIQSWLESAPASSLLSAAPGVGSWASHSMLIRARSASAPATDSNQRLR
jgi:ubiquinone/menaquinone biosynthesis C-methylase UbiE